ncbi:NUDIX hydrolase [Agilicoccus flavus]|uniref:NUDIX hydrolase n=1 Tax=Agilicoccus flavus TaxID=2775968 RepID=UPI001CF6B1F5|nr:NUDIX hydrolase [Agilicoccus flavus]
MPFPDIRFCRLCGAPTAPTIPAMEDRERAVCTECGYVDYVNPINVVGTIPVWHGEADGPRILLCLRNIEPRRGFWTLPAGFLEYGETAADGAARETREEAGAHIELEGLFSVLDVVHAGQIHLFYRARLLDLDLAPGPETIENRLVSIDEIPWDELAFLTVRRALEAWVADHERGSFEVHTGVVTRSPSAN